MMMTTSIIRSDVDYDDKHVDMMDGIKTIDDDLSDEK